jgi:hypothetical protein
MSSKPVWALVKQDISYNEYNKVAKKLFKDVETFNEGDFSFGIISRYVTSKKEGDKLKYTNNLRLYLQTKLTKKKEIRFSLKQLQDKLGIDGLKEWIPDYEFGTSKQMDPFLQAHAVSSCSDAYIKMGYIRRKGNQKKNVSNDEMDSPTSMVDLSNVEDYEEDFMPGDTNSVTDSNFGTLDVVIKTEKSTTNQRNAKLNAQKAIAYLSSPKPQQKKKTKKDSDSSSSSSTSSTSTSSKHNTNKKAAQNKKNRNNKRDIDENYSDNSTSKKQKRTQPEPTDFEPQPDDVIKVGDIIKVTRGDRKGVIGILKLVDKEQDSGIVQSLQDDGVYYKINLNDMIVQLEEDDNSINDYQETNFDEKHETNKEEEDKRDEVKKKEKDDAKEKTKKAKTDENKTPNENKNKVDANDEIDNNRQETNNISEIKENTKTEEGNKTGTEANDTGDDTKEALLAYLKQNNITLDMIKKTSRENN